MMLADNELFGALVVVSVSVAVLTLIAYTARRGSPFFGFGMPFRIRLPPENRTIAVGARYPAPRFWKTPPNIARRILGRRARLGRWRVTAADDRTFRGKGLVARPDAVMVDGSDARLLVCEIKSWRLKNHWRHEHKLLGALFQAVAACLALPTSMTSGKKLYIALRTPDAVLIVPARADLLAFVADLLPAATRLPKVNKPVTATQLGRFAAAVALSPAPAACEASRRHGNRFHHELLA